MRNNNHLNCIEGLRKMHSTARTTRLGLLKVGMTTNIKGLLYSIIWSIAYLQDKRLLVHLLLIWLSASQKKPIAFATCDITNSIFIQTTRRFCSFINELKNKLI